MSSLLALVASWSNDDRIAIADDRGIHSYAELAHHAASVAAALRAAKDGNQTRESLAGERVAILAAPNASFVAAFFGVLLAGGAVVVLSPLHPPPEQRFFCEDAGVRTILAGAAIDALFDHAPRPPANVTADAPALQLYTSGTTGRPKGAILTHRNIAIQQKLLGEAWGFSPSDVLLHALPLHHMHGLAIALFTALGARATTRLTTFDAAAIWNAMKDASVFMGVPAMYHRLFAAFDAADETTRARFRSHAKHLRLATSGSAALPVTLAERWRNLTGTIPLERFGMTEIGVGLSNRLAGERFPGCVGFPLPTVETRIVAEGGREAKPNEPGELRIRGPSVFAGYHARPEETKSAFVDGWFRTGDTVTRIAEDGPFKILGRTSVDILKSGGYKLSALEIEEALREHPAVGEVAVVGIPDEAWGERVVACVVLAAGAACEAATLKAHVKERLAAYKVPKDVLFLAELPKNALGKVVKPNLVKSLQVV